jgi:hygromycin-B 7''-O-kinase
MSTKAALSTQDLPARLLPEVKTGDDYVPIYRDVNVWLPAMRVICQRHGLDADQLEFAPAGTHVVFKIKTDAIACPTGLYIKLFARPWREDFVPEQLVLSRLSRGFDLPTPRLMAEGEIEGWPYLIMTAVKGVPLCEVWETLDSVNRAHIAARCGELMAALHAIPTEGLEAIATDWPAFVKERIQARLADLSEADTGAEHGLNAQWVQDLRVFLNDLPPLFEPGFTPVLLSADITDEHLLVTQRGDRWALTGFIDMGDAMLGHPLYEFVAPGCLIARGDARLLRTMLRAYGYADAQLNARLSLQLMAYTLVHRYVKILDLLDILGLQHLARAGLNHPLAELARTLWSFDL